MKNIKPFLREIKEVVKKLPVILIKNYFLAAVLLLLLGLVLSGLIFYKYATLAQTKPLVSGKSFQFQEEEYFKILNYYQQLQQESNSFSPEGRPDPFRPED